VEQLEILLLLFRTRRAWTAEEVARELRIDPHSAARRLGELAGQRILDEERDRFSFAANGANERDVLAVSRCYAERRVSVITFIFSRPNDRLRSFADAFRIKGGN
jgi:hypothetical protein